MHACRLAGWLAGWFVDWLVAGVGCACACVCVKDGMLCRDAGINHRSTCLQTRPLLHGLFGREWEGVAGVGWGELRD